MPSYLEIEHNHRLDRWPEIMRFKIVSIVSIVLLATLFCFRSDNLLLYIPYTFCVICLTLSIGNPRVSIFLKFLIGLFLLGNWLKVTIHGIFDYPYVEATGRFSGTIDQWERFYLFSIAISAALLSSVIINSHARRTQRINRAATLQKTSTIAFAQASIILILLIYALNWQYGFYRIGIAPELNLPFGLNAPASFLVYLGAPMLIAIIATNSVVKHKSVTRGALISVALLSLLAAIVTYSRATVAVLMLPIILGMYKTSREITGKPQSIFRFLIVIIPTVVLTLASVSVLRITVFGVEANVTRDAVNLYIFESLGLFIDRWIGAEGLMVAVSTQQSFGLFLELLVESPSAGAQGVYQNLADSQYLNLYLSNMTFLTLPGVFALLAFSGSFMIVFGGVMVICFFGVAIEQILIKTFDRQYTLQYLISGSIAFHFSQMIFPVLIIPFIIQLLVFLVLLRTLYSRPSHGARYGNHNLSQDG